MKKLLLLSLFSLFFIPTLSSAQTSNCTVANVHFDEPAPGAPVIYSLKISAPTGCASSLNNQISTTGSYTCPGGARYYDTEVKTESDGVVFKARCSVYPYQIQTSDHFITVKFLPNTPGYYCNRTNPLLPKCEYRATGTGNTTQAQCSEKCKIDSEYYVKFSYFAIPIDEQVELPPPLFQVGDEFSFSLSTNLPISNKRYSWNFDEGIMVNTDDQFYFSGFKDTLISYKKPGKKKIILTITNSANQPYISTSTTIEIIPRIETSIYADGKLLKSDVDNGLPVDKKVNLSVKSTLPFSSSPFSYLRINKLGTNDVSFFETPDPNYDSPVPFSFKSPGRYRVDGTVFNKDFSVSTTTNLVINCPSDTENELKTKEVVNRLLSGKVTDINADSLKDWFNNKNAEVISSIMNRHCDNYIDMWNGRFKYGYDAIRALLNDDPGKVPLVIQLGNSVNGYTSHAVVAVGINKNKDNSKINSIRVVDPNDPSKIRRLDNCVYTTQNLDIEYIDHFMDETKGVLACSYPYDAGLWGGKLVGVGLHTFYEDSRNKLRLTAYTHCQRSDVSSTLCSRYLKFGDWLSNSLPLNLENFRGDLDDTQQGVCNGWSKFLVDVTYLGNFVGGNSCKLTLEDTLPSVAAAGLPDLPNLLFKIREFLNQSMPLLKLNK